MRFYNFYWFLVDYFFECDEIFKHALTLKIFLSADWIQSYSLKMAGGFVQAKNSRAYKARECIDPCENLMLSYIGQYCIIYGAIQCKIDGCKILLWDLRDGANEIGSDPHPERMPHSENTMKQTKTNQLRLSNKNLI
jgi:hypothetical protein